MERQTSEVCGRCSRVLNQLASENVLTQPGVRFSIGLLSTKFQETNFLFSCLWQLGRGKYNVQTAIQKTCWEKLYRIDVFQAHLGKYGKNILCTPKKFVLLHLCFLHTISYTTWICKFVEVYPCWCQNQSMINVATTVYLKAARLY